MPSHYLNQSWIIVNWILRNKSQWNSNQSTKLFIHKNAFENVCEMVTILSRGEGVNSLKPNVKCQLTSPSLVQIVAGRLFDTKPLSDPTVPGRGRKVQWNWIKMQHFVNEKWNLKCLLQNGGHYSRSKCINLSTDRPKLNTVLSLGILQCQTFKTSPRVLYGNE